MTEHKRIGRITGTLLGFEDHGFFTFGLDMDYGGSAQTVGLFVLGAERDGKKDISPTKFASEFIMRVLMACGVRRWEELKGRTVFVLFDSDAFHARPIGIENLPTEPGERFMFSDVQAHADYEQKVERKLIGDRQLDPSLWLPGWRAP